MDVFAFRHADHVRLSPDGRHLAFAEVRRDVMRDARVSTLMLSANGGAWAAQPESEGIMALRWAPDSRRLAMLQRHGHISRIIVLDAATGGRACLFETPESLRELAWSPDGRMLAFQMFVAAPGPAWVELPQAPEGAHWAPAMKVTERTVWRHDPAGELPHGSFQVMALDAGGGAPVQVTQGTWMSGVFHPAGLAWTADGAEILLSASRDPDWDRAPDRLAIHAVRLADGAVRMLGDGVGAPAFPAASPDGRWVAFVAADGHASGGVRKLRLVPAGGGAVQTLAGDLDRTLDMPVWTADSAALLVAADLPGRRGLVRVGLNGGHTILAEDVGNPGIEMPYSGGGFSAAEDGTIAYALTTPTCPSDVVVLPPGGPARVVTALNAEFAAEIGGFRDTEALEITAPEGHRVQAWLMLPAGPVPAAGHPMILEIHGGPFAQFGAIFSIKYQLLAAAGYAVLSVNPRGSTGRGEDFAAALRDRFPGPDHDDLMAMVDAASARPDIDAGRLFITGVSGGGVLTLWGVAHTHRFRAAVSIKPVVDWQSWTLTADIGALMGHRWLGDVQPWENPAKYRARSPLTYAGDIRTPTLLIGGEADSRTPDTEALQMYTALRVLGVPTAYARLPGASHSSAVARPSHIVAEVMASLGWFGKYLGG